MEWAHFSVLSVEKVVIIKVQVSKQATEEHLNSVAPRQIAFLQTLVQLAGNPCFHTNQPLSRRIGPAEV